MNVKFTKIQTKVERQLVQNLYNQSVPAHEKSYFYPLWWKRNRKNVSFLNIYDGDKWVGWIFYSVHNDLIKVTLFATIDSKTARKYDGMMFDKLKKLYPHYRIITTVEIENLDGGNREQVIKEQEFCKNNGFKSTGYFVKRKTDSFEFMLVGDDFDMTEHYKIDQELYPIIGKSLANSMKKQIQKSEEKQP
ncbi:MAG: hypothetical protein FWE07_04235 [Turicibacter sp.]|nr:hypothetical protein [Turicibacter sp.]